ncbi:MAG: GNAT family N-acetyltransferase [Saprospiraceae bacterium]|nr:GNAT family N-acetyltransferase [Saprospiraceae bacterium]
MEVKIRYAQSADLPTIFAFVKDLALFEKAPEAVTAEIKDYENAFESRLIGALIAESNTVPVGVALYYETFSTWKGKMLHLEDFIVSEDMRGKGIGRQLFESVIEEAKKRQCKMMKWQVLDWNTSAVEFYKKYDCFIDKEWWDCKLYF